jgi:hypothetical protein
MRRATSSRGVAVLLQNRGIIWETKERKVVEGDIARQDTTLVLGIFCLCFLHLSCICHECRQSIVVNAVLDEQNWLVLETLANIWNILQGLDASSGNFIFGTNTREQE